MAVFHRVKWRLRRHFNKNIELLRIFFMSLFYNDLISWSYAFDTLLEPLLWLVDTFAKGLGPIFVFGVVFLTGSVVAIAYYIGFPYYWANKGPYVTVPIVILGHYLLINIVFHYVMAIRIHPGKVPLDDVILKQVTSICKKCVGPKPPRTHHCSVCDECVLKMDHHCPWLNGCVGHFNHRHFFLYMAFMVSGCFFIMVFGFEIMWREFLRVPDPSAEFYIFSERSLIVYETVLTSSCFGTLGGLTLWHALLISRGETSIEAHVNESERKRHKRENLGEYKNPYDFGRRKNWCLFLGMIGGRGWTAVFFPTRIEPKGTGLEWDSIYSCDIKWNDYARLKLNADPAKIA